MNPHILNGERLLHQGRAKEAATAFKQGLTGDPNDGHGHALLALALVQTKDIDGAFAAAREAARLEPGEPFTHYVMGFVALVDGQPDLAERAANEALRLQPDQPEYYRLLAMVWVERRKWERALEVIDQGLALDPEHTDSLNLRSQVLIHLRRTGEARGVSEAALASSPDDAHSHANAGWAALHQNNNKEALKHFKESLRLDPGNDWAKAGLAEAIKARNPLYRVLLGFMLWMVRLDPKVRMGVIIGGYVAYRIGDAAAAENPAIAPFVWPLLIAYIVFAWMTWVGMPLADLTLQLSPYGRNALSPRQRLVSSVLGLFILAALAAVGLYLIAIQGLLGQNMTMHADSFSGAALMIGLLALITVGVLQLHRAPRYKMLMIGCAVLTLLMLGNWLGAAVQDAELVGLTRTGFTWGFVGMMWFVALGGGGTPRTFTS